MVQLFLERGAQLDLPPDTVTNLYTDSKDYVYRKAPFLIQAACADSVEVFKTIFSKSEKIYETGFICLSKKKRN
jgi:ankyrin repeat protein